MQVTDLATSENVEAVTVFDKKEGVYEVYLTSPAFYRHYSVSLNLPEINKYNTLQPNKPKLFRWLQSFFN